MNSELKWLLVAVISTITLVCATHLYTEHMRHAHGYIHIEIYGKSPLRK